MPRVCGALELCGVLSYHSNLHSPWYGIMKYRQYNVAFDELQCFVYYFPLFCGGRLRGELPACVVDGVGCFEDQLGDRHNGVAVVDEAGENGRQCLWRVQRGVVEQDNAPRLHPGRHPLAYRVRVIVLPVEGVPIGKDLKPLRRKGLRV